MTGMELEGTVRMRYDPERRAAIMAWLGQQGVDISVIARLTKQSANPQASEGELLGQHLNGFESAGLCTDKLAAHLIFSS